MRPMKERLQHIRAKWAAVPISRVAEQTRRPEEVVLHACRAERLPLMKKGGEWWLIGDAPRNAGRPSDGR